MKFGLFYEHQLPRPWDEDSELALYQQALEQCELADRLGFDTVWEVEHHFLEEYSQVILVSQAGKTRHEHICESLELFGREVLPEFLERDERAQREKARRLAPVVERVMARKPASDHPPLPAPDYTFPALPRAQADRAGADAFHQLLERVADDAAVGDQTLITQWREGKRGGAPPGPSAPR